MSKPPWLDGRIAVEVDDEEGSVTVCAGGVGLAHSKSHAVALYIARALRAMARLEHRAVMHAERGPVPASPPSGVLTRANGAVVGTDGVCRCELCVIYRGEQEP